jgi:hypothetical protein
MGFALPVEQGFFPLDEELALLPGSLTPRLQEHLVRLGTWIPSFDQARKLLADFTGAVVSEPTARRQTEEAGAAYVAIQEAEVERLERELPPAPPGPAKQLLSVDGAMVPLVHGEWAEVKTLALGIVEEPVLEGGEWVVHTRQLSYFSRLTDSDTFARLALVETHRRGVETAGQVGAVMDGAEWGQGFVDFHRPDAVRILDFPHGKDYIRWMGEAVWGEGKAEVKEWLPGMLHRLKHDGPCGVLADLTALTQAHPELPVLTDYLAYLKKREAHMQYPLYQAQGWPIGSGAVESGNKLVIEARLKGAGMHWAREHVNPMVALRDVVCSDRWEEAWPQIASYLRQRAAQRRLSRQGQHRAAKVTALPAAQESALSAAQAIGLMTPRPLNVPTLVIAAPLLVRLAARSQRNSPEPVASTAILQPCAAPKVEKDPYRPPPDHPWRRPFLKQAKGRSPDPSSPAKL